MPLFTYELLCSQCTMFALRDKVAVTLEKGNKKNQWIMRQVTLYRSLWTGLKFAQLLFSRTKGNNCIYGP